MAVWLGGGDARAAAPEPDEEEAEEEPKRWHLDVQAQTNFPVDIGGRLSLEMPGRLRLATSVGALPGSYVDVMNDVAVATGAYTKTTAKVLRGALQRSLVWRLHAGWRPFPRRGLYLEAGYGLAALGGGLTSGDVLALITNNGSIANDGGTAFDVSAMLHMIDAEVGWQWQVLDDHLVLRAAIGYAGTLAAQARIEPTFNPGPLAPIVNHWTRRAEDELESIATRYIHTPVVTLGVGYRFF